MEGSGEGPCGAPLGEALPLGGVTGLPVVGGTPGAPLPLPLVSVPGLWCVVPTADPLVSAPLPLVPVPLLSLPGVPGFAVLSPSPAPVPVVPVWLGLVSIGGRSAGEVVGLADFPVVSVPEVSPGVVVPLPVELGLGDEP
jgi:hypothetical protein